MKLRVWVHLVPTCGNSIYELSSGHMSREVRDMHTYEQTSAYMRPIRMPVWSVWQQRRRRRMRCYRRPSGRNWGWRQWRGMRQLLRPHVHQWWVHGCRMAPYVQWPKLGHGRHRREAHGGWGRCKPGTCLPLSASRDGSCCPIHLPSLAPARCFRLTSQQMLPMRTIFLIESSKLELGNKLNKAESFGLLNYIETLIFRKWEGLERKLIVLEGG